MSACRLCSPHSATHLVCVPCSETLRLMVQMQDTAWWYCVDDDEDESPPPPPQKRRRRAVTRERGARSTISQLLQCIEQHRLYACLSRDVQYKLKFIGAIEPSRRCRRQNDYVRDAWQWLRDASPYSAFVGANK